MTFSCKRSCGTPSWQQQYCPWNAVHRFAAMTDCESDHVSIQLLRSAFGFADSAPDGITIAALCANPAVPDLLLGAAKGVATAADYCSQLRRRVSELLQQRSRAAAVVVLEAGVYCLASFMQRNQCGPIQQDQATLWQSDAADNSSSKHPANLGQNILNADERWVASQLEVDGEELIGRVQGLDWLLAAVITLVEPCGWSTTAGHRKQQEQQQQHEQQQAPAAAKVPEACSSNSEQQQQQQQFAVGWLHQAGLGSWCWWALRAVMAQQHVLHGKCNTLQTAAKQLMHQTLCWAHSLGDSAGIAGAGSDDNSSNPLHTVLAAAAHLECALVHQHYGHVLDAAQQLEAAAGVLGVAVEVTGALGFRTKHQMDAKPQLVATVKGAEAVGAWSGSAVGAVSAVDAGVGVAELGFGEVGLTKELEGMEDDSAVYLAPRLAEDSTSQQQQQQTLSCMQQALLLGWASQIKRGTSKDELQQWQMAPFVEAVLQQQHTHYMLHATARLLKCRHEKERGRTRERSLMQLEQLCQALEAPQPAASVRLPYAFSVRFPLWPLLRKELAELYIGMGFVGAALKIFESLEMWDQLIVCYRLLDKRQAAQELVLQRIKATPDDAKLWCVLGDIQQQEQHYVKAWEVSGGRSSRAQRALGRAALQRKEYQQAVAAYELALGLNPLYPDAWFALGYCHLKMGQTRKALQAFSKVTQLEFDHGEAWTNLAGLWLQEGGWSEALHASEQAVKYKRDSWQTWENYATAAVKAHAMMPAVRALGQVFELTRGEHVAIKTAEQLMEQLEQEAEAIKVQGSSSSSSAAPPTAAAIQGAGDVSEEGEVMEATDHLLALLSMSAETPSSNDMVSNGTSVEASAAAAAARERAFEQVKSLFGQLLKSVANSPACSPAVWGLYARWHRLQGQLLSSQEASLKQVRGLQSTPFKSDLEHFSAMAAASIQLCQAYLASAAASQYGLRDLAAARMHLKGVLKQCQDSFGDNEHYQQMSELLQVVAAAEDAALTVKRAAEAESLMHS